MRDDDAESQSRLRSTSSCRAMSAAVATASATPGLSRKEKKKLRKKNKTKSKAQNHSANVDGVHGNVRFHLSGKLVLSKMFRNQVAHPLVQVEYVPEKLEIDESIPEYAEFAKIFQAFQFGAQEPVRDCFDQSTIRFANSHSC